MKMDSVELDHYEECIQDTSADQLLSPVSPGTSDIYADPQLAPRIGDDYQVNIPPLISESDRLMLIQNPTCAECMVDVDYSCQIGLPIPVMWVHEKREEIDFSPVPGSLGDSWSDIEEESFLLGLYIFGKNLGQVKKFMETKETGDILSFYYGSFYRSDRHRRWSECRKIRSRRCIRGHRIFTGLRQQELLSRLLSHVSQECGNTLLEVSKVYSEGKVSLEEYVSTLKATVGLSILVEAIGIGKGKQDLTGMVMEPIKTNQIISSRSEIPIGKACSSLTSGDIIKFLTGNFRLSKARSNDLFWEAVWPRLLARGWHSEQPKNHSYVGSKNSLVFLIPAVKKFSRRRLVKGTHYFDSVSDVLNKVALDPRLLELEVETVNGSKSKEDYGWDMDAKLELTGPSDHQRHCYLRPRLPNCNPELMKFTVVDTSLVDGEEPYKVRELRCLPVDSPHIDSPASLSRETGGSSEEQVDEPDPADMLLNDQESYTAIFDENKCMLERGVHSDLSDYVLTLSKQMPMDGTDSADLSNDNHKDQNPDILKDKHPAKSIKCQFSRRIKSARPNYLSPVPKRRRLNACNNAESSLCTNGSSGGHVLKEEPCSPDKSSECILSENCFATNTVSEKALSHEKPQSRALFDLNLPHVPPDFETGEPFIAEEADRQPEECPSLRTSNGMPNIEPARRQSTRNRPLTTKALEALACGFFNTKRQGRGTKALSHENAIPKPSSRRRAHGSVGFSNSGNVGYDSMDTKVEGVGEECISNINIATKSHIQSERRGTHDIHGLPRMAHHPEILTGQGNIHG
ncbi:uncharacterized protein LOC143883773 [Tasmannia lanceolata]|uniref:uncharacterized protein LOC143883773 n=1 Tax=Tasmannia lanceolata TaxID=3420 RepID=UPI004062FEE3